MQINMYMYLFNTSVRITRSKYHRIVAATRINPYILMGKDLGTMKSMIHFLYFSLFLFISLSYLSYLCVFQKSDSLYYIGDKNPLPTTTIAFTHATKNSTSTSHHARTNNVRKKSNRWKTAKPSRYHFICLF